MSTSPRSSGGRPESRWFYAWPLARSVRSTDRWSLPCPEHNPAGVEWLHSRLAHGATPAPRPIVWLALILPAASVRQPGSPALGPSFPLRLKRLLPSAPFLL